MPPGGVDLLSHSDILSYEEMLEVATVMAQVGVSKVRITGGEPLVRAGVVGLVARLKQIPGIREVVMTTNGLLLDHYAHKLKAAGLDRLNLSLDTLRPERYRHMTRLGNLEQFWRGVEAAVRAGFDRLKLNVVAIRGFNDDEFAALAGLAEKHPWQIRFIEYMPMGGQVSSGQWQQGYISNNEVLQLIQEQWARERRVSVDEEQQRWYRVQRQPGQTAIIYRVSGFKGTIGFISPLSQHFCGSCNRLRLSADGKLYSCLLDDGYVELKSILRSGASRRELLQAVEQAAALKPLRHQVSLCGVIIDEHKNMSRVGG